MNLELGVLKSGNVLMVGDQDMPGMVKRIEYYREQQLMMLVYQDEGLENDLFEYEVPQDMVHNVEKSPDVLMYVLFDNHEPVGYKVPLIKVGDLY